MMASSYLNIKAHIFYSLVEVWAFAIVAHCGDVYKQKSIYSSSIPRCANTSLAIVIAFNTRGNPI